MGKLQEGVLYQIEVGPGGVAALYDVEADECLFRVSASVGYMTAAILSRKPLRVYEGVVGVWMPVKQIAPEIGFGEDIVAVLEHFMRSKWAERTGALH